jgi:hypothetical protein
LNGALAEGQSFETALAFSPPGEGKDKAFWWEDFSKYAALPQIPAGLGLFLSPRQPG